MTDQVAENQELEPSTLPEGEEQQLADGAEPGPPEAKEKPKEEPPAWWKERIDELTRDKHEARRQAERLEAALKQQEEALKALRPEPAQQGPVPPDPSQYVGGQFDPRYMQDMVAYATEKAKTDAIESFKAQQQAEMQRQEAEAQQKRLATAEATCRAKYSDYDAAIAAVTSDANLSQNQTIRDIVLGSEQGPEIAYLLGKNLDVAYELTGMSPFQAGLKVAELMNRAPRTRANAPAPAKPIGTTGGNAPIPKSYETMTTAEYIAARNAEEAKARGRK